MSGIGQGLSSILAGSGLTGPGTQPVDADGSQLEYMVMPEGMAVFSAAHIPEPEVAAQLTEGVAAGDAILAALRGVDAGGENARVDLTHLDAANLAFVDQLLGEGEVSVVAGGALQAQESVLAGVWRVREYDAAGKRAADYAECGAIPSAALAGAFAGAQTAAKLPTTERPNIFNAPALIAEVNAHIPEVGLKPAGAPPHVINLSLLPHTEEDLLFLEEALGRGDLIILSRGYGNCRIRATATRGCWWVQYFNSQDTLILNTIELSPIPEVCLAAPEDIEDSVERLEGIMDIYR